MGTRCLVIVKDTRDKTLLNLYRQMDGDPSGIGVEIYKAFKGFEIINGISGDTKRKANGMGCFAAQLVKVLKQDIGSIYLNPVGESDVGEAFIYTITSINDELFMKIGYVFYGKSIFSDYLDNFDIAKINTEINRLNEIEDDDIAF